MALSTLLPATSNAIYSNNKPCLIIKSRYNTNNLSTQPSFSFNTSKKLSLPVLVTGNDKSKRMYIACNDGGQPGVPLPSGPPGSNSLKGWIIGIILSIFLPSFRDKWGPLLQLKSNVDSIVQTVEDIAESVEKVAEVVDKVVEDIVDDLPEGQLKNAAKLVENLAEKIDKSAETLGDIIDKAQEMEDKLEDSLESSFAKSDRDDNEASKPVETAA